MPYYTIKAKARKTQKSSPRYKNKVFKKGKTYEVKRKLTPKQKSDLRKYQKQFGFKILSIRKIKRK